MGLQYLLESFPRETTTRLLPWADDESPLVVRALAAGFAEPRILADPETALAAVEAHRTILERIRLGAFAGDPDKRVLIQGLSYTVSVVVAGRPAEGFLWLRKLVAVEDPTIRKIMRENLKKKRLARVDADAVAKLTSMIL